MTRWSGKLMKYKRKKILKEALIEFSKEGYANASTNQIVRRAGVSKGSLFNYFGSKEELYLLLMSEAVSKFTAGLKNTTFNSRVISERFASLSEGAFTWYSNNRDLYHFMITLNDAGQDIQQQFLKREGELVKIDFIEMIIESYQPGAFTKEELHQIVSWLFIAMKSELSEKITRLIPLDELKTLYFKKFRLLSRFLEKGISGN
jgi:AcrR family transcriptional regulator